MGAHTRIKQYKLGFIFVLLTVLTFIPITAAYGGIGESIKNFDSQITVNRDGSMVVKETITARGAGVDIRHGIYRDFPIRYTDRYGTRYSVDFHILEILRDGQPEPYHTSTVENGIRIYIGNKDILLNPGTYTYTISYYTKRQLGFFPDHDELYWNVTGNGWTFPIESTTATIMLPERANIIETAGYTGAFGSNEQNAAATRQGNSVSFTTTQPLDPYQGLTVVVTWPKGIVREPTAFEKLGYLIRDNMGLIIAALGLLGVLIYYISTWNRVGRDPDKGPVIPIFEPPAGLSPAAVRFVRHMGYDTQCFAAAVINMAVKGVIQIQEDQKMFTRKTYAIEKKSDNLTVLAAEEKEIHNILLPTSTYFKFENEHYQTVQNAVNRFRESLESQFEDAYFITNIRYFFFGLAISLVTLTLGFILSFGGGAVGPAIMILFGLGFVHGVINIIFFFLLKAPTLKGRRMMDQIEGFKLYLSVAEKDRLNLANPPDQTPELFEKYLPYALALDVGQQWAERFTAVLAHAGENGEPYHPGWYAGHAWSAMNTAALASSLGGSFSNAISSSATPPGSSSGSGGGGFSGGGGGGGGGGGW